MQPRKTMKEDLHNVRRETRKEGEGRHNARNDGGWTVTPGIGYAGALLTLWGRHNALEVKFHNALRNPWRKEMAAVVNNTNRVRQLCNECVL